MQLEGKTAIVIVAGQSPGEGLGKWSRHCAAIRSGRSRAQVAAERDPRVPLRHKMGTGDVTNAALFLAPMRPTLSSEWSFSSTVAARLMSGESNLPDFERTLNESLADSIRSPRFECQTAWLN